MPQAFTQEQMERIRSRLFESACRRAVSQDARRISLEQLTSDAGISKSTFYKFFDSKEQLFLQVGLHFEMLIVGEAERVLRQSPGLSSREAHRGGGQCRLRPAGPSSTSCAFSRRTCRSL